MLKQKVPFFDCVGFTAGMVPILLSAQNDTHRRADTHTRRKRPHTGEGI